MRVGRHTAARFHFFNNCYDRYVKTCEYSHSDEILSMMQLLFFLEFLEFGAATTMIVFVFREWTTVDPNGKFLEPMFCA